MASWSLEMIFRWKTPKVMIFLMTRRQNIHHQQSLCLSFLAYAFNHFALLWSVLSAPYNAKNEKLMNHECRTIQSCQPRCLKSQNNSTPSRTFRGTQVPIFWQHAQLLFLSAKYTHTTLRNGHTLSPLHCLNWGLWYVQWHQRRKGWFLGELLLE